DVCGRYLPARGLDVTFVRNFTDIDDKIIRRANEEGITAAALAEREVRAFQEDVAWLGCLPPTHEPRATEHIPAMLALAEQLVAAGFAYAVPDGSVYFRVRRFPAYGKLSHRRLDDMEAGEEIDPAKEDPHDFALWKGGKTGEPWWPSPWGRGRPGWHRPSSAAARTAARRSTSPRHGSRSPDAPSGGSTRRWRARTRSPADRHPPSPSTARSPGRPRRSLPSSLLPWTTTSTRPAPSVSCSTACAS